MDEKVVIPLTIPIQGHEGLVREVVLRAPRAGDFFALGEIYAHGFSQKGDITYRAENTEVVRAYIERLVESPNALLLEKLSLVDAMKVKGRVLAFFMAAALAPSEGTATSSSSS